MNFWSVGNVQKHYISINPYLSNNKKFYPMLHLERSDGPTLSEPLASLITFFRTSLIKFYHNSQRMSVSFLSHNSVQRIKSENNGPKHTNVGQPCFGIFA